MKCLRTTTAGNDSVFLTSIGSSECRSKLVGSCHGSVEMEGNSCIEAMSDNLSPKADSCRTAQLNGRLKSSTPVDGSSSDSSHLGNNNSTGGDGLSTVLNVVNSSECYVIGGNALRNDAANIELEVVSKTNVEFNAYSRLSGENTDFTCDCSSKCEDISGINDPVKSSSSISLCGDKNSPESEISLTLSPLAVSCESEVPSSGTHGEYSGDGSDIRYIVYESERQMADIMKLITKDLSEPYSIYTYRYFIHNWPKLCYLAMDGEKCIGAIVCKLDRHRSTARRGYIAMLAVDQDYRRAGIGSSLVVQAIRSMTNPTSGGCDEVVLETEISNGAALRLYEKLGFVRDKRLFRYYLNGVDALRLKLWLK